MRSLGKNKITMVEEHQSAFRSDTTDARHTQPAGGEDYPHPRTATEAIGERVYAFLKQADKSRGEHEHVGDRGGLELSAMRLVRLDDKLHPASTRPIRRSAPLVEWDCHGL